jgi:DNA-directed RNA polymerase subunit RPC12/RpoP
MKCPHCKKEISESGFVYCPHCGKKLVQKKGVSLRKGGLLAFIIWAGLTAIAFVQDTIDGPRRTTGLPRMDHEALYSWAPQVTGILALAIAIIFCAWVIYTRVKRQES